MKKPYPFLIISVLLVLVILVWSENKNDQIGKIVSNPDEEQTLCYQYEQSLSYAPELFDRSILQLQITADDVRGHFSYLPAEKDSKVGAFEGTIDDGAASVLWSAVGEGVQVQEELLLEVSATSAVAMFGEMIERTDGVYAYRDRDNLYPGFIMEKVACAE